MMSVQEDEKPFNIQEFETKPNVHVSIKLSSNNKKKLTDVCNDLSAFLISRVSAGTSHIPRTLATQMASITTRKSPCGEGTNTWARYKFHVYSKMFEIGVPHETLANIAEFLKSSDVEIILRIKD